MTEHDQTQQRTYGALLAGIGIGAIVAGIAALLLAPKTGSETRGQLKESTERVKHRAESLITGVREKVQAALEDKTSTLTHAIEAGKQAYAEKRAELESQVRTDN
jgi:gas vesicle protein